MVVILNERMKSCPVLLRLCTSLDGHEIKYSKNSTWDFCIQNSCGPHIAIALFDAVTNDNIDGVLTRCNSFQSSMKFAFGICDVSNDETWFVLNHKLATNGCIRALRVQGDLQRNTSIIINSIVKHMTDKIKLDMQSSYFAAKISSTVAPSTASSIASTALTKLRLSSTERDLLMRDIGSIRRLLTADIDDLLSNSPVHSNTLRAVHAFFHLKYTEGADER